MARWDAPVVAARRRLAHCAACKTTVRGGFGRVPRELHLRAIAAADLNVVAYVPCSVAAALNQRGGAGAGAPLGVMHLALVIVRFSRSRHVFDTIVVDALVYKYSDDRYRVHGERFLDDNEPVPSPRCPLTRPIDGVFASLHALVAHICPCRAYVQVGALRE